MQEDLPRGLLDSFLNFLQFFPTLGFHSRLSFPPAALAATCDKHFNWAAWRFRICSYRTLPGGGPSARSGSFMRHGQLRCGRQKQNKKDQKGLVPARQLLSHELIWTAAGPAKIHHTYWWVVQLCNPLGCWDDDLWWIYRGSESGSPTMIASKWSEKPLHKRGGAWAWWKIWYPGIYPIEFAKHFR